MRGAAWLLSLLLLLAPLGLAQDGEDPESDSQSGSRSGSASSSSTSHSSSSSASHSATPTPSPSTAPCADEDTPEQQAACERDLREDCRQHPADRRCQDPANRTEARDGCRGDNDDDEAERCEDAVRRIGDERGRDWIGFQVDAANASLLDYTIAGLLAIEQLHLDLDDGNLSIARHGATLHVRDGEAELRLHDEPNGLIRFKGADGNVTMVFPANATVAPSEHGASVAYDGGRVGHLLADNATWLGNHSVLLNGFFAFHVPPRGAAAQDRPADPEVEEGKQDAIERRTLGAEVTLKPLPEPLPAGALAAPLAGALNDSVQILAYDDVEVEVELPEGEADAAAPVRVVVSSELEQGRTIVLNLDEGLLSSTDPADLQLRYFDLHNQTDGTVLETEVVFAAAASLQDVLEPGDDGGQPEFWVVEDANGVQVLVSVPHWSSHAITVASIATALHAPSVAVGIVAGIVASTALGALLMWPRRRDDEF